MKIPKYEQIKNDLLKKIKSGEFENGDRFYSEAELIKLYNVSSVTVIRAIQELAKDGYLVRYQGKGTFVSRSRKRKLVSFTDIEIYAGEAETVTVLSMEEGNDNQIKKRLKLKKNQSYTKIIRIRKVEEDPFMLHVSYIPSQFIKNDIADLSYYDSIYNRFKSDFGIHMYEQDSREIDEICFPTDAKVAEVLRIDTNVPTARQEKVTTLEDGTVAELVVSFKKWNYYKFELTTYRNQ